MKIIQHQTILLLPLKVVLLLIFHMPFNPAFSQNHYNQEFQLQSDNDLLTFKRKIADRYYSFGEHLDYRKIINEESKLFVFSRQHIKNLKKVVVNWHLGIEGYTSDQHRDTEVNGVFVAFDRPYAGWSFISNQITATTNKTQYFTKLTLGVLGPISGAEQLQNSFHQLINSPKFPEWKNQIQNEVAGNIAGGVNHTIFHSKNFDIYSASILSLGTEATFFKQGIKGRFGLINTIDNTLFYHTNLNNQNEVPKSELFIGFGADAIFWGYKATIQGRFFGDNINMDTSGLRRLNADVYGSINFSVKRFAISFTHHIITAETLRGRHFYYGSLSLIFKL